MSVNNNKIENLRVIISGGGTGGHIFPAIAIANAIKQKAPEAEILFVGALGRIEMEKVPEAGYKIVGLPVAGFQRRLTFKNFSFFTKLFKSIKKAGEIIEQFQPNFAVGVGGYASGPLLYKAGKKNIPYIIQEQNSYAGVTNKLLAKKAKKICVAYEGLEKFFQKEKIIITGNPVRQNLLLPSVDKAEAYRFFGLQPTKKTVLIVGGSGGARSINEAVIKNLEEIRNNKNIQFIFQTGKVYFPNVIKNIGENIPENLKVAEFISKMEYAYQIADLVVTRAGAGTISELCIMGKPAILVPSPNVAEDHQTKNAMALVKKNAALLVSDFDAPDLLMKNTLNIINNDEQLNSLKTNILKLAIHNSAEKIADVIFNLRNV